jgi:Ala-tRNA(Pro) deacylase
MDEALRYLNKRGIKYTLFRHEAVFTCEAAARVCAAIPGHMCKNLFLTDRKSGKFYLVTLSKDKRLDIKGLIRQLGENSLRFAVPEELMNKLMLEAGSVSPLGLINDKEKSVVFVVDREIWDAPVISIHPNVNTASLSMDHDNFHKLVESFENKHLVLSL